MPFILTDFFYFCRLGYKSEADCKIVEESKLAGESSICGKKNHLLHLQAFSKNVFHLWDFPLFF